MPKGIIFLQTMPRSADVEAQYHDWYDGTHLQEICAVEGITGARRYAPIDGDGPFVAIYELDTDDLGAVVDRLRELGASGTMSSLQYLSMDDPPPVPKVYREIGSHQT